MYKSIDLLELCVGMDTIGGTRRDEVMSRPASHKWDIVISMKMNYFAKDGNTKQIFCQPHPAVVGIGDK